MNVFFFGGCVSGVSVVSDDLLLLPKKPVLFEDNNFSIFVCIFCISHLLLISSIVVLSAILLFSIFVISCSLLSVLFPIISPFKFLYINNDEPVYVLVLYSI